MSEHQNKAKFISCNYTLKSGKYKGKTLKEVSDMDESFIDWFTRQGYYITGMNEYMAEKKERDMQKEIAYRNSITPNYAFDSKIIYKPIDDVSYMVVCKVTGLCITVTNLKNAKGLIESEINKLCERKGCLAEIN